MSEEKKVRHSRERDRRENHDNDVELRPLEKDGDKLLSSLEGGQIVAVQSGLEIMYVLVIRHNFQCFIHKMDAEDGRTAPCLKIWRPLPTDSLKSHPRTT